jgi:hypothetical protein
MFFFVEPRHLGRQLESAVALDEIDRWLRHPGIRRPERLEIERGPPQRRPEWIQGEVVEQPVDLPAQRVERPPRLHEAGRRRGGCGGSLLDGNFALIVRHLLPPSHLS